MIRIKWVKDKLSGKSYIKCQLFPNIRNNPKINKPLLRLCRKDINNNITKINYQSTFTG